MMAQTTECKHCTVPTDSGDVCSFCRTYVPPAPPALDRARGHLDTAICHLTDAASYLHGARATRAQQILDRITAALADLDRIREAL